MATANDTDHTVEMRCAYHVQRAKRLIDTLRAADRLVSDNRTATSLLVVSNELQEAVAVLNGTATPKRVEFYARVTR
jgi:hypothetical protein